MWKSRVLEKLDDLKDRLKGWSLIALFIMVGTLIFGLLKIARSSKRLYITTNTKRLFRINNVTGLLPFYAGCFKDDHSDIAVSISTFDEDGENLHSLELAEFLNDYTEFRVASDSDRLLYGLS